MCHICPYFDFNSARHITFLFKKQEVNKGINFKSEDGTHGTANWMSDKEINSTLGNDNSSGIILGKYKENILKLSFESYFNKNICVFR